MKRFIFSILCVAVFFIGVGSLVENTKAKFKYDQKALDLIAKARVAIGGDAAINSVQSMVIKGRTTRTININGTERSEPGDTEIALQFPDKMSRSTSIGKHDGSGAAFTSVDKQVDVVVVGGDKDNMKVTVTGDGHGEGSGANVKRKIIVKKDDGTVQELTGDEAAAWIAAHPNVPGEKHVIVKKVDGNGQEITGSGDKVIIRDGKEGNATFTSKDGKTFTLKADDNMMFRHADAGAMHSKMRNNDMLRTTLSLLLTAPKGMDVNYTSAGDGDVDGTSCDIVVAEFGGASYKLYLSKATSLPVMMSYTGMQMPKIFTFTSKDGEKGDVVFDHKLAAPKDASAEFQVRFSDYRSVNGVQLPFNWTQTVGGKADETFDVTTYEINPANIADKFQNQKVMVRTRKPDGQ